MSYKSIYKLQNPSNESNIIGANDKIIALIEEVIGCEILLKQAEVKIDENDIQYQDLIINLFTFLETLIENDVNFGPRDIINIVQSIKDDKHERLLDLYLNKELIIINYSGKAIYPKSLNQQAYIKSLQRNEINIAVGPAGTGKTYLAVLYAVSQLRANNIKKIVLVRPVVEAGERLGFLPGDFKEKIDPYLIPLYDALDESLGSEHVSRLMEKGIIEVAPLAYMRGRTLDNAIIILDEAQNATTTQMKMFLTRLGFNSQMIITGDVTQIDLPSKSSSGLVEALKLLKDIKGIGITYFQKQDVMRHPLVYKIIKRYEAKENGN
ncbi:MAG TPA: PhoH family protein [Acholeplasmataceae bacterium]|nr:PhoH family protein [Acholeplasmataceae bacterium]